MGLKDQIRAARDRKGVPVEVPEWGATVYVRRLSGRELVQLRDWIAAQEQASDADKVRQNIAGLVRVVTLGVASDDGEPLFDASDADWLADKSLDVLERLSSKILDLNGASEKAREGIRGNSEGPGASPSASPSSLAVPTSTASLTS